MKRFRNKVQTACKQMVDLKDAYAEVNQKCFQSSTSMNREVSAELRNSLFYIRNGLAEDCY